MNNCETISEVLGAWLDGELGRPEAEAIRAHVEQCSRCGEERRRLERLQSTLKSSLEIQADQLAFAPLWHGVQRRIAERRVWYQELYEWAGYAFTAPRLAWAVPVAIAVWLAAVSIDSLLPGWKLGAQRNNFATVEFIDAYGRNVTLLRENETRTTVIWLYQNPEGENESTSENSETSSPSF